MSSSGGYATTKPHTRSSWTCTYKAGHQHQGDTHIWETPLPEPSADEYTLPTNMRKENNVMPTAMLDSMDYTVPVSTKNSQFVDHGQSHTEYTLPMKSVETGVANTRTESSYESESTLPANSSNANYYYYDPSASGESEYMQPATLTDDVNIHSEMAAHNNHNIESRNRDHIANAPVKETVNPVYKTLIRAENINV